MHNISFFRQVEQQQISNTTRFSTGINFPNPSYPR